MHLDRVEATRNIRTFDPTTRKIKDDAIPEGEQGTVEVEDFRQGVVCVLFDNGIRGNFGPTLVDKLDAIRRLPVQEEVRDMMAEAEAEAAATASLREEQLRSTSRAF